MHGLSSEASGRDLVLWMTGSAAGERKDQPISLLKLMNRLGAPSYDICSNKSTLNELLKLSLDGSKLSKEVTISI